ncbi:MAG: prepilin-type N-terminal cleavage/methylation domain-containing protein [Patescibacteria group bacterium]|nr:prepilin-type N-terminal cleavage/methylation domain-containing protein [Patescibacteria group bacterium]
MNNQKGVSLVELLLVVALIAMLGGLSLPFYRGYQIDQGLDTTSKDIVQALREAQNMSVTGKSDDEWGVHFDLVNQEFGVYQGVVFSEYYYGPSGIDGFLNISTDFGEDIYFLKTKGEPFPAGNVTIDADNGSQALIEINNLGLINLTI